jgi:signal peptidase I
VDRLTYNFRPPNRGEIIVFETRGIPEDERMQFGIPGDQFYIKRLVVLGGEKVQLNADRHVRIDGKRLDASVPHFENVYGFIPSMPPRESHYSGHVDGPNLASFFHSKPGGVVKVPGDQFMVMGDNTLNSLDSRAWGYFPANSVIGRGFFVYWPFSERFGACFQR